MNDTNDSPSINARADDEEAAWYSLLQRSRAFRDSGEDEQFVSAALDAFRQRPHRAEPLHDLTRYYLGKSRGDIALIYADAGMAVPLPEQDHLGVEEDVYRFQLKEAFAIAASYSKDPDEKERGRIICSWLSMNKALPHWTRVLARQNSRWYAEPANLLFPSIRFNSLSVAAPEGFKPGNISLVRVDDGFVALVRAVNYDLLESGYFDRHGDTSFRQRVLLSRLDRDLGMIGTDEVLLPDDLPPPRHFDSLGFEDPRPFIWRNELWCLSCVRQLNEEGRAEMVLARIVKDPQGNFVFTDWRVLASGRSPQWEKNWMPQVVGNDLRFIYSVDPARVLSESGDVLYDENVPIAVENFRGGTQAIPFDGGWLMLIHEWELAGTRRNYFHRFIWLDSHNRLARVSRRFLFFKPASEFAAGLAWHVSGDGLIASFGIDDHSPTLATIEARDIRNALLDIDEHERAGERACQAGRAALDALLTPSLARALPDDGLEPSLSMLHQVHLINLDRSAERLVKFRRRNPHLDNVVRIRAVDGASLDRNLLMQEGVIAEDLGYPSGTLGCALSHVNMWKKAVSENRIVTIFEDDVICADTFQEESTELLSRLRDDWDIVHWGYVFWPLFLWLDFGFARAKLEFYDRSFSEDRSRFQSARLSHSLVKTAHVFGLQAYTISPKGARALLEYCLPLRKRFIRFPGTGVVAEDTGIDCTMCGAYSSMQAFTCLPPFVIPDYEQPSARLALDRASPIADTSAGEYEFTVDWFSHHIQIWEPLLARLRPARILEIGSFEGRSTCYLIEVCSRTNHVEIYCVDTWEGGFEHNERTMPEVERRFDHNVEIAQKRASHGATLKKLKKKSVTVLAEILSSNEPPFDLIYVDGSHQASDVLTDSILAFQLLRVGGLMIFDDYLWSADPAGKQDTLSMPKAALDSFINLFQRKLRVISGLPNNQLYIEKLFS